MGFFRDPNFFVYLKARFKILSNCVLIYSVLEPDKSPWPASQTFGPVLTREQALSGEVVPNLFALVDAIAANEHRLSSRILSINAK